MIELNESQKKVFNEAIDWWRNGSEQTFEISGPPGSGKTFLINTIVNALGIDVNRILIWDFCPLFLLYLLLQIYRILETLLFLLLLSIPKAYQ